MARVTSPLMSQDASGTVGKAIVFAKWKGRNYVRRYAIPSNPKTASQTAVRAMMAFLSQTWAAIKGAHAASWEAAAASLKISQFNAYVGHDMLNWRDALIPVVDPTIARSITAVTTNTATLTHAARQVTVQLNGSATPNPWGIVIYRKLASSPSGVLAEVVKVLDVGPGGGSFVDRVPSAGTWHYRGRQFSLSGATDLVGVDANIVVT